MYFNMHKIKLHNSNCVPVCKEASQHSAQLEETTGSDISTVNISCYFSVASGWLAGSRVNFDSVWALWSQLGCSPRSAAVPRRRGTAWEPPPRTGLTNTWCQDASHVFVCVGVNTHFRFISTWTALTLSLIFLLFIQRLTSADKSRSTAQ